MTDEQGNTSGIEYDLLGRKTRLIDPNMLDLTSGEPAWEYSYDDNSNLVSQEDPRGTVVEFSYDELDRVYEKTVVEDQGWVAAAGPDPGR